MSLVQLNDDGTSTLLKRFFLAVPQKRVYGGCQAVPASLVARLGGPYVCGWGGYTSLVMQGGNASIGPTMYAIPDPDTIADGATSVPVRVVLDAANAQTNRGVRKTIPQNYFDGGDPRANPPTRPTSPPQSSGQWLSPNAQGLGWMVWGDSYYNTGVWIGETFAAVASLCKGACWYQSSTLAFDGRQFELHTWAGSSLGTNILQRPTSMVELTPPIDPSRQGGGAMGNRPVGNLAGATYDPVSGKLYVIGWAMHDAYTARLYTYGVGTGPTPPPPPPPPPADPVDAVVSDWSAWAGGDWSACSGGTQTRTETRTRTVITPASNGGSTPALSETRTASQACTVTPPPPPPPTDPLVDIKGALDRIEAALTVQTYDATVAGTPTRYSNGDYRIVLRVPASALTSAPASGATVTVVKD
ncbi:MAG: hypothetical protein IT183_14450 [Acidobacteria bacterium]|nr:hypothetical protein [Acidobacteriota bacterium]